jgi:flagellar biosynthetic protein FlhB
MEAPRVVAKGVDSLALRIRQVADENEVPILENPPLARALFDTVEIDEEIPAEYYKAVAEIISFVFKMKKAYKPTKR